MTFHDLAARIPVGTDPAELPDCPHHGELEVEHRLNDEGIGMATTMRIAACPEEDCEFVLE
jgi:hypothetical protein